MSATKEDIWGIKPAICYMLDHFGKGKDFPYYNAKDMDAFHEKLKVEHDLLKEHSGRWLHFVAVDYPEIKESLSPQELMELKDKAEKWDLADKIGPPPHGDKRIQWHIDMSNMRLKLEAIKKHFENFPVSIRSVNQWINQGRKILEAAG